MNARPGELAHVPERCAAGAHGLAFPPIFLALDGRRALVAGVVQRGKTCGLATRKQFKAGHRVCLEIFPYHVCRSETVTHSIYHDAEHPLALVAPGDHRPQRAA